MTSGYSGTPLATKLGFKKEARTGAIGAPETYLAEIPAGRLSSYQHLTPRGFDFLHLFTLSYAELEEAIPLLQDALDWSGTLWVSWPKQASKVPTDVTEESIRQVALPNGLVDIKVCAVDEVWSGLKLVHRRKLRQK